MVVATDNVSWSDLTRLAGQCHEWGIKFIAAEVRGLAAMAFVDFTELPSGQDMQAYGNPPMYPHGI